MSQKESFYFSHDYNARNDDKILELRSKYGAEGYGIFWMIIESMAENEDGGLNASYIGGLSIGFGITKEKLCEVTDFLISINLLYKENNKYFSKRLLNHKQFRKFLSDKGKEGVRIREEKKQGFKGGLNYPSSKERKGKERKENDKEYKNISTENELTFKLSSLGEIKVLVLQCEDWAFKELKDFVQKSQQNFESVAMTNPLMNNAENFKIVIQQFVNMIQSTDDYQESSKLRKFFGNWVSKKNGSLQNFIDGYKNNLGGKKNKNSYI